MNYQQAIAAVIKQILYRIADAATTAAAVGFGFLSFFPSAADAAMAWDSLTTTTAAAVTTTTAVAATAGFGFLSSFPAAADAATTTAVAVAASQA